MTRVVVTGMGIVSSIGNNTQEVLVEPALRALRHHPRREIRRTRLPQPGAGRADAQPGGHRRPPRDALRGRRRGVEPCRDGAGDPRRRAGARRGLERAHRHHHGLGRAVDPRHRRGRRHRPLQGAEAGRPLRGAEVDVLDRLGDAVDLVQDQGRQPIRSPRPARPPTIASARRASRSASASRT